MNLIENYLAKAAGLDSVSVGDDIRCQVGLVTGHDITAPMAIQQFEQIGDIDVFDKDKVVFVVDHIYPASTVQARKMQWILRNFYDKQGIHLYDRGQGVIHQVLSEKHRLAPGEIIVGADSHTCTAGGYGVIGIGVGATEMAATMATGTIDLEVPEVVQIYMQGQLPEGVFGKDVILHLASIFGTDGLTDRAMLLTGPGIESLSENERMTICNMGIELGAMITLFGTTKKESHVAKTIDLDLTTMTQKAAAPYSPGNIKDVADLKGTKVTQVAIGSCTNGRINDMEQVYLALRDNKVHPDVNVLVFPASKEVLDEMEENGWTRVIRDAGATILNPGCGPCFGAHMGLATEDDVVASTTNRNFPGRMGAKDAKIYLVSPYVAVRAAINGEF